MSLPEGRRPRFAVLLFLLAALALLLALRDALAILPAGRWGALLLGAAPSQPAELMARYGFLPQVAIALIAGAALALSGLLLQHALRNVLAEPTTLGTSAGASLALAAATVFAPAMLEYGRIPIALAGAAVATGFVLLIAARERLSASSIVLAGIVVAMTAGAATGTLLALFTDYMGEIFVWQSGSLVQNGDTAALGLAAQLAGVVALVALFLRPIALLGLEDAAMAALGLRPWVVRLLTAALGVVLAAGVAAAVGVIAFVGLAAPAFARMSGARGFAETAVRSAAIGAFGLLLVDRLSALVFAADMPAGAITAVLGAPLLLALARTLPAERPAGRNPAAARRTPARSRTLSLVLALAVCLFLGLFVGPSLGGGWLSADLGWGFLVEFRGPRVVAALAAGVLLAIAGGILQRMSANPLAAPEALGISGGATIGVLAALLLVTDLDTAGATLAAGLGALAAATLVLAAALHGTVRPERLLLSGLALTMMATGWAAVFLASGDPRTIWVLSWLSGSTYRVSEGQALFSLAAAFGALLLVPLLRRHLTIMPLGNQTAVTLGLSVRAAWGVSFLFAAGLTAVATLVIGPLSFVGLTAPHIARLLGYRHPTAQLSAAAAVGAIIMVLADWVGRIAVHPWETPAGIVSALFGGIYMLIQLRRR